MAIVQRLMDAFIAPFGPRPLRLTAILAAIRALDLITSFLRKMWFRVRRLTIRSSVSHRVEPPEVPPPTGGVGGLHSEMLATRDLRIEAEVLVRLVFRYER